METTFIYIMQAGEHFKIGITKDIKARVKQIQTGCPVEITFVAYITVKTRRKALDIEKGLHSFFYKSSSIGEWFLMKKGWKDNVENFLRVQIGDITAFLKIYISNNKLHEYSALHKRVMGDKTLTNEEKIDFLNKLKGEILRDKKLISLQKHININIERLLKQIAVEKIDISKEDYLKVMENVSVKKPTIKSREPIKRKKTFFSHRDTFICSEFIKKAACGKDIPKIEEIIKFNPVLCEEGLKKIQKIKRKIQKAEKIVSIVMGKKLQRMHNEV